MIFQIGLFIEDMVELGLYNVIVLNKSGTKNTVDILSIN